MRATSTFFFSSVSRSATLLLLLLLPLLSGAQSTSLVISQVYGGGGNASATYTNDFIELHNISNATINLTGYSVQYASGISTTTTWAVTQLSGTIASGAYYLVKEASTAAVGNSLPNPDVTTGTINLSATVGKVALANSTTAFTTQTPTGANLIDFVGYGSTTNAYEGTGAAPAPSAITSIFRVLGGCTDTDNNVADFVAATPAPRNSATATNFCSTLTATPTSLNGFTYSFGSGPSASQSYSLTGSNLTSTPGTIIVSGSTNYEVSANNSAFSSSVTVAYTTANLSATTIYVRLKTGLLVGSYNSEIITNAGGGATRTVMVSGSVTSPTSGVITVTGTPLTTFNTLVGFPSTAQPLTVSGTSLGTNNLVITPPVGYEISVNSGTYQTTAATLIPTSGKVPATPVAIRLTGNIATASLGATLQISSSGSPSQDQTVSGAVIAKPTAAPTITVTGSPNFSSATLGITAGTGGTRRIVVVRLASASAVPPSDRSAYTANSTFGNGATTGTGNFVVLNTSTAPTSITVTGLTPGASYIADAYEYNYVSATPGFESYLTTAGSVGFTTTLPLLGYDFDAGPAALPLEVANVTGNAFSRGSGVTPNTFAGQFNGNGFGMVFDGDHYYEFTLTTNNGYQAALTSLALDCSRSPSGPTNFELRSSLDNYGSVIGVVNTVGTTSTNQTITLSAAFSPVAAVTFRIYAYGASNAAGTFRVDNVAVYGSVSTVPSSVTYIWNGLVDTNWTTTGNWTPVRLASAISDVLVFDGVVTPTPTVTVDFPTSGISIQQLLFRNHVTAILSTDAPRTLTLAGNATGDDFVVSAGSTATFGTTGTTAAGLNVGLMAQETGSISGTLVLDGIAGALGQHTLLGMSSNAIQFLSGSVFRTTTFYDGSVTVSPFGVAANNAGSVVFRNGSRYEQFGGNSPFGPNAPVPVLTFEAASRFVFAETGISQPSLAGRTYGILDYNTTSTTVATSTSVIIAPLTVLGDLIITNGIVGLNLTGGINIAGNIRVDGASSTLGFTPATVGTIQLNGITAQNIGGAAPAGSLTFGSFATLLINNATGVTLQVPLQVNGTLNLTKGLVTTNTTNLLTLANNATNGSNISFVNGPLARITGSGIASTFFPIGKGTIYRPLTLTATAQAAASTYTAEQVEGNLGQSVTAPLQRVSFRRFFSVKSSNTTPGNFSGTISLSFGSDDYVNVPTSTDLVIAKRDAPAAWFSIGHSAATGTASGPGGASVVGTLTSNTFSNFSDFVLGALNLNTQANPFGTAINPLPVELTSFSAQRQVDKVVAVNWTTASEKNSAYFEVQRSLNGQAFAVVAKATAQGTSSRQTAYVALDKTAPGVTLYYRLRQVDRDGTANFSPVVTVIGTANAPLGELTLYPNPTQRTISFAIAAATPYRVLNQLGQVLLQGTTEAGVAAVEVSSLLTGIYHLELQTKAGRVVRKFVRE